MSARRPSRGDINARRTPGLHPVRARGSVLLLGDGAGGRAIGPFVPMPRRPEVEAVSPARRPAHGALVLRPLPVMLGFQNAVGCAERSVIAGRRALAAFARSEGYALGTVVLQTVWNPLAAVTELIKAVERDAAAVVAVPTLADLGRVPRIQTLMYEVLGEAAGVPVLIAERPTR